MVATPIKHPPDLRWINEKEVAQIKGRALQSLRNARTLGRGIPYAKICQSVRDRLSDVVAYMERHTVDIETEV